MKLKDILVYGLVKIFIFKVDTGLVKDFFVDFEIFQLQQLKYFYNLE